MYVHAFCANRHSYYNADDKVLRKWSIKIVNFQRCGCFIAKTPFTLRTFYYNNVIKVIFVCAISCNIALLFHLYGNFVHIGFFLSVVKIHRLMFTLFLLLFDSFFCINYIHCFY